MKRIVVLLAIWMVVAGACTTAPTLKAESTTVFAPLASGELPLVTEPPISSPSGMPIACAGIGLDTVLRGDPADSRLVWLENHFPGGAVGRLEAVWPAGYRVRFAPKAEVLNGSDQVVLRDGDSVTGACGVGPEGAYLEPPFK